jgi:RNA polymerase sigma factor (sigma-70 family)
MTPDAAQPTDESLASALRRGDDSALDTLMLRWQVPLRSFLYRHLQNEADALDYAQETFVRIYRHRANYREGAKFSTWMFQIALNLCRDHGRRLKNRPLAALDEAPDHADTRPAPDTATLTEERAVAVRTAIAALPENLRTPLLLSTYDQLSHIDIAAIVKSTPKAVETRLARARELLKTKLGRWLAS